MKITKSQLRKMIQEEYSSEADSIARDQASQIGQENFKILDKVGDALLKGGDETKWVLDNDDWQSLAVSTSDADTEDFIKAINTVLSDNLGTSIAELLGEGKMKITKSQLQTIIKEEIQQESEGITDARVQRAIDMLYKVRDLLSELRNDYSDEQQVMIKSIEAHRRAEAAISLLETGSF